MSPDLSTARNRIHSIDILRGAVMLIMAIDHVRDFFHAPAMIANPLDFSVTTTPIFLTRWITHFCAPTFVFLSGLSAFISGQRKTKAELSSFLIKRGLWLVLVELTVITFGITFDPLYRLLVLQVIWAIGWSMVILGLLVRTSYKLVLLVGLVIFLGHNLLDYATLPTKGAGFHWLTVLLTSPVSFQSLGGGHSVMIVYPILPWAGIMLLGYSFGYFYRNGFPVEQRRKIVYGAGFGLLALFVVLRLINHYGDPFPWTQQKTTIFSVLSFVNITKYPVSLQYGCLTIGTALVFLGLLEQVKNRLTDFLTIYGKVPFFYYVLHFFLIHLICAIFFYASGHTNSEINTPPSPFMFRPFSSPNYGWGLPVVYLVWLGVILLLYYPVRWFNRYKDTHRQWWLSYL